MITHLTHFECADFRIYETAGGLLAYDVGVSSKLITKAEALRLANERVGV